MTIGRLEIQFTMRWHPSQRQMAEAVLESIPMMDDPDIQDEKIRFDRYIKSYQTIKERKLSAARAKRKAEIRDEAISQLICLGCNSNKKLFWNNSQNQFHCARGKCSDRDIVRKEE